MNNTYKLPKAHRSHKLSLYRAAKAKAFNLLTGKKGINPHVNKLRKEHNIIIKNQKAWLEHNEVEIQNFIASFSPKVDLGKIKIKELEYTLETQKFGFGFPKRQELYIFKEPQTPVGAVSKAILDAKNHQLIGCAHHPLTLVFSSKYPFNKLVTKKGTVLINPYHFSKEKTEQKLSNIISLQGPQINNDEDKKKLSKSLHNYLNMILFGNRKQSVISLFKKLAGTLPSIKSFAKSKSKKIRDHFNRRVFDHTINIIASYNEIPILCYDSIQSFSRASSGFGRLFADPLPKKRVINNLRFLKWLYINVPERIAYPSLIYHDIGKIYDETFHEKESAKLIGKQKLLDFWDLDPIDKLIIKKSIEYHGISGGINIGEYSFLIFNALFDDPEMRKIINAGRADEFFNNLTLLTLCDIAGQENFVPLHKKMEDSKFVNSYLKSLAEKIRKYNYSKEKIFRKLYSISYKRSVTRIYLRMSSDDQNLDLHTNNLNYSFYKRKLQEQIKKMAVKIRELKVLRKFMILLRSSVYSRGLVNYLLWDGSESRKSITKDTRLSEKGSRFFLRMAYDLRKYLSKNILIDVIPICEDTNKPLSKENYDAYVKSLKALIDSGGSPKMEKELSGNVLELKVYLPKPEQKDE